MLLSSGVGTLKSPLDGKEIQPAHPKENQSWIIIRRTDVEAPILWPPDAKNWLTGKDPDAEQDWRQEEKGITEAGKVGWHHRFDGHEFEQVSGVDDGQGSLACYHPWVAKSQIQLSNWTELKILITVNMKKVQNFSGEFLVNIYPVVFLVCVLAFVSFILSYPT